MLSTAIYVDALVLFAVAVILFICSFIKPIKKKSNTVTLAYIVFTVIALILFNIEIVEFDWMLLLLNPGAVVVLTFLIVSMIVSNLKKQGKTEKLALGVKIAAILIPVIIFVVPFIYETSVVNNCDVLVKYNYQNGIVTSKDTFLAIRNDDVKTVTIRKNIFERKDAQTYDFNDFDGYRVKLFADGTVDTEDLMGSGDYGEKAREIALAVNGSYSNGDDIYVYYLAEKDIAIVRAGLAEDEGYCRTEEEFYYHDSKIIEIISGGNLETVTFFEH